MNAIAPDRIVVPGIYDFPNEAYHADPCETPSLSAGMINDILKAPAKCWANSRRLNPDWEPPDGEDKFTVGAVSHVIFLEEHLFAERVVVIEADDWRKDATKAKRDVARSEGKTPILAKHMDRVRAARSAFMAHPFVSRAFAGGVFERSLFWRHPTYGFWCRARPDFIADGGAHLCDYKATANADPQEFGRHGFSMGYHRRAAWYLDGHRELGGDPSHYWFINQETRSPYLASIVELDGAAIEAGRAENERAAALFNRCLRTGDWFGYRHPSDPERDVAFTVPLPNWAFYRIDERAA